jgi:AraC-like DNA-binding protein
MVCSLSVVARAIMDRATRPRLVQTRRITGRPSRVVVSDPVSGRRVDVSRFEPDATLVPWIDVYWGTRWDLRGQSPHDTGVLSDPTVHLVIERGRSRLVGTHRLRFSRRLEGQGRILGTKLWPAAIRGFVDVPVSQWTDRIVPLREVVDVDIAKLERAVLAIDDDGTAFELLGQTWRRFARPLDEAAILARKIVEHVASTEGVIRVEQLVATFGIDERALQRLFVRNIGVTPKWVIRRVRLQEAAAWLERSPAPALAELAARLGYADQAHFARDFTAVVGVSPRAFAKRLQEAERIKAADAARR